MSSGRLLGICGSLRSGSFNRKLMLEGRRFFDPAEFIDGNIRFPLYDGDLEEAEGVPDDVTLLAEEIARADAVLIAGPEYNKNLSGVLKNALDWVSRTKSNPWRDKPVAVVSAAAGRAGGERSQNSMRLCLVPFRAKVLPGPEVLVGGAGNQFDEDGKMTDPRGAALYQELMGDLRQAAGL